MNTPNLATDRRSDLDALRAVAMLLGIVLHASLAFFPSTWMVIDSRQDPALGVLFWAIHGFRMPAFFVMSGFFSAMLLGRRGIGGLVLQRFRRVFLPLLLGMATFVPLTNWIVTVAMSSAPPAPTAGSGSPGPKGTSLGEAAEAGDLAAIERLLASGAKIEGTDGEHGLTPLLHAVLANRPEAVELLIRKGADPNLAAVAGGTPLHAAAFVGNEEVVARLVKLGAEVNATNGQGQTPLDVAVLDVPTTIHYGKLLHLTIDEDGLGGRKAAIADLLRQGGGHAGKSMGAVDLLMQIPVFGHLWFLWFLWWLALGLAAVSAIGSRLPTLRLPDRLVISPLRYLWLIPLTMALQWFMGDRGATPLFGPDTSSGLLPIPHVFAYYAIFFGFGAIYHGHDDRDGRVGATWWLPLAIGLLVAFPLGMAASLGWPESLAAAIDPSTRRPISVVAQAAYPWLMTFGLMGLFRRFCSTPSPAMRYLSDSAYWLYLAHLPLVIAGQYAVRDWPIPAAVKLALVVAAATALLLGTYQAFVRYSWVGRFLNGPRTRPEPVPAA